MERGYIGIHRPVRITMLCSLIGSGGEILLRGDFGGIPPSSLSFASFCFYHHTLREGGGGPKFCCHSSERRVESFFTPFRNVTGWITCRYASTSVLLLCPVANPSPIRSELLENGEV